MGPPPAALFHRRLQGGDAAKRTDRIKSPLFSLDFPFIGGVAARKEASAESPLRKPSLNLSLPDTLAHIQCARYAVFTVSDMAWALHRRDGPGGSRIALWCTGPWPHRRESNSLRAHSLIHFENNRTLKRRTIFENTSEINERSDSTMNQRYRGVDLAVGTNKNVEAPNSTDGGRTNDRNDRADYAHLAGH
jgi:hypothetical protein